MLIQGIRSSGLPFVACLLVFFGNAACQPVQPAQAGSATGNDLQSIKNEFVGGVAAIRDSAGRIIGWGAQQVGNGINRVVVQPVVGAVTAVKDAAVSVARPVVNTVKTIGQAGGQIVDAWGNAIHQTGAIAGQAVSNIGRRRRK